MNTYAQRIRPHVAAELRAAHNAERQGLAHRSFTHLERAHVLGQASTVQHVRVHLHMLSWAVKHRRPREALGQVMRIVGAATKTAVGWVPQGNTGGSNVSPFKPMPIPPDLRATLEQARARKH